MSHTDTRTLTPREAEVLELVAHGLSNGQLADQLGVTVHAVKFHLASIYRKLAVANRTEAAGLYFQHLAPMPPAFSPAENGRRSREDEARRERALAAPPALDLPSSAHAAPASAGPLREEIGLGHVLTAALQTFGAREHVRIDSVVLAGLAALLHRYTHVEDVVVGSDGGPLWLDTAGDPSFGDLVRRVEHEVVHPALDRRASSGNGGGAAQTGLRVSIACAGAACDLTVTAAQLGDELVATATYDGAHLERAVVARFLRNLATLLAAGAQSPSTRIAELDLLTADERSQMLQEWNATAREYPHVRADELIARQAAARPAEVAVEFEGRRLTYAELDAQANGLACVLQGLGVGRDVLVAVCIERSAEMLVALLGIMRAGGAYVPVDPAFPADRQQFMLEDAGVRVIVTQESLLPKVDGYGAECVCLDRDAARIAAAGATAPPCAAGPDDLAYVIYTSGSTGRPKGVQIPHRALANFLTTMAERPGLSADDVLVAVTTLSFDIAGLELYLPLATGGRVIVAPQAVAADPRALATLIESARATVVQATPTTWRMLVDSDWPGRPGLKALCGGEALPQVLAEQLLERGLELWNMYGPTETTIWSTVSHVRTGERLTIGRPIANTALYVLDDALQPMPVGVAGELHIGGDGVARGYLNRPELTEERFVPNPFDPRGGARMYKTGDLARYREDGTVDFLGRRDHQVKIRGFRIELGEIETALARRPGITSAVAVAREDTPGDARLVAYVVLDGGAPEATPNALRRSLADVLPAYMIPSAIVVLDELPLTPNGKIDRKALPEPTLERDSESAYAEPRTDLERRLVDIWEDELGIRPIGVGDDFFDLGLTSIVAARLFARLEHELGSSLPLGALFRAPTIERLAVLMSEDEADARWTSLVPIQPEGTQPPLFCVHGGAGTILHLQPLARSLGPDQPFYGLQARGLYGGAPPHRTVEQMAAHYLDELRTVQPHGPYYLAGYCFGSIVAFDMAQRLLSDGEEVNLLAVFNGPSPSWIRRYGTIGGQPSKWDRSARERSLAARVAGVLTNPAKIKRWTGHLAWRLEKVIVDPVRIRLAMRYDRSLSEEQREVFFLEIAGHAQTVYEPSRYPGPMVVFYGEGVYEDPGLGWSGTVESVETYDIPGPHRGNRTLMAEPAVTPLAARLQEVLERARRGELRAHKPAPAARTLVPADG